MQDASTGQGCVRSASSRNPWAHARPRLGPSAPQQVRLPEGFVRLPLVWGMTVEAASVAQRVHPTGMVTSMSP